jgi:hypothetical protein
MLEDGKACQNLSSCEPAGDESAGYPAEENGDNSLSQGD